MGSKLLGKKVAIIVAHEFEDIELLYPILRLNEEGLTSSWCPCPRGSIPAPN